MNQDLKVVRAELLAHVKSFQSLAEVGDVRKESCALFANAVGEYLMAEEELEKELEKDFKDFATVVSDLASGLETLAARLSSTAALILEGHS